MLTTAIILFAAAAIFGLTILIPLLQNKPTPKVSVFLHGALAATALIILIIFAVNNVDSPTLSIVFFVVAALGGFLLAYRDLFDKKPGPKALAVIHALAAVTGFLILLFFAL